MSTVEELKREIARLKAQREVREDFARRDAEKRVLQKQLAMLKRPKLYGFARKASALGKGGVSLLVKVAKDYQKYQQKKNRSAKKRR
jgi:hypothetical protein